MLMFTVRKFKNSLIMVLLSCSSDYFYAKITLIQLQQEKMKHHVEQSSRLKLASLVNIKKPPSLSRPMSALQLGES